MKNNTILKQIDDLYIITQSTKEVLTLLTECINSPKEKNNADSMVIYGDSRAGKTSLIKHFIHNRDDRILYCEMPVPATSKGLISMFLANLEDPFAFKTRKSTIELTMRLEAIIKKLDIRMIVLDETQHLVESNNSKRISETSDWFKNVINRLNIPVIFLGMKNSKNLFIQNIQLSRRIYYQHTIEPMSHDSEEFKITIRKYNKLLTYPLDRKMLVNDTVMRIHATTMGYHGFIKRFFYEIEKQSKQNLTTKNLEEIVYKCFSRHLQVNPFAKDFDIVSYYKPI